MHKLSNELIASHYTRSGGSYELIFCTMIDTSGVLSAIVDCGAIGKLYFDLLTYVDVKRE